MLKKTTFVTAIAAAVLSASMTSVRGQDTGKLQFQLRLQEGQAFKSEMVSRQKITQSVGGREMNVDTTVGTTYKYEVQAVTPDGSATLKVTIDGMSMAMEAPNIKMEYDSADPPAELPPSAKGLAAMVGKTFSMEMNSRGEVTRVEGIQAMLDAVLEQGADPAVKEQLRKQFGGDSMVANMQAMLAPYPGEPVAVGDSWSNKVAVTAGFPMQIDSTYTLKGRSGGMATLAVESKITTDPNAEPLAIGPAKATVNISGTRSGEMVVHETAGWTMSSKLSIDFKGSIQIVGASGMTVPLAVTGETTVKTSK